jgi:hypothetical protein
MALTTIDRVASWAKKDVDPMRQDELQRCIDAAEASLDRITGRRMRRATRTAYFSGKDLGSDRLMLPIGDRPVLHTGGTLITCTENGIVLTLAIGYSPSAGVIIEGANGGNIGDGPCVLLRNGATWHSGPWYGGQQNIVVTYSSGWELDGATQPVPADVIQLASAAAWLIFTGAESIGKSQASVGGASVSFEGALPPFEADVLQALKVV